MSLMTTDFSLLSMEQVGQVITVGGFVHSVRDHGGLIFIDLRNGTELLQCVIDPEGNQEAFAKAEHIRSEFVLKISGEITARSSETVNPKIPTGHIELKVAQLEVVASAKVMPFDIHAEDDKLASEEIRLKYRYLDLRRSKLKHMMTAKHKMSLAIRNWFDAQDFIEVQTPILANSSPEGARDYLIPSRLHPGKFYALPQAPQQFKQLLMVGGFGKYFQIAPCFRDEDPRSDRHPGDFYQIDAEIAWADQESIFTLNEKLAREVLSKFGDKQIEDELFLRLRYDEAMDKYGSDKPDLRYEGLEWQDAKGVFAGSGFTAFASLCDSPRSRVQALVIKDSVNNFTRSDLDKVQEIGRSNGLPGIAYIQFFEEGVKSPILKFFGNEAAQEAKKSEIMDKLSCRTGDLVLFVAHSEKNVVYKATQQIREHIAKHLDKVTDGKFINKNILKFVWIYDFPFFEVDDKTGKLDFAHNPFGVWKEEKGLTRLETLQKAKENNTLTDLRAIQYDLTLNGYEVLSGGVRNSNPTALIEAFLTVGYTEEEVKAKFRHMMEAYEYAAPPHAGFAWGLDRLFMILMDEDNIREIIAFPKNGQGIDAMTGSPNEVTIKQLKELSIQSLA